MGEVPDAGAPVLQVDVTQPRTGPTISSIAPQCKPGGGRVAAGGLGQHGGFGCRFEHDQACGPSRSRRPTAPRACAAAGRSSRRAARRAPFRPTSRRRAARRTCRSHGSTARVTDTARIRSPCSRTSSSRLPNSTPLRGQLVRSSSADADGCRAPSLAGQIDAVRQQRRRAAAAPADGSGGKPKRSSRNRRMSVRIHSSSLRLGSGSSGTSVQAASCMPRAQAGSSRGEKGVERFLGEAECSRGSAREQDRERVKAMRSDRSAKATSQAVATFRPADVESANVRPSADYPTEPSICSSISRFISTAYSIGSSLTSGSMKPLTIIVLASASDRPRLVR